MAPVRGREQFVADIREWTAELPSQSTCEGENHASALLSLWFGGKTASEGEANEATRRLGLDGPINLAFDGSGGSCNFTVHLEAVIAVPRADPPEDSNSRVPFSAKADVLAVTPIPTQISLALKDSLSETQLFLGQLLFYEEPRINDWVMGLFTVEEKCADENQAVRQLMVYLCSIQCHRYVLGLKRRLVYGVLFNQNIAKLYVSFMCNDGIIRTYPVRDHSWDLGLPRQFVQCFYYLLALRDRIGAELLADVSEFEASTLSTQESQDFRSTWRFPRDQSQKTTDKRAKKPKLDHPAAPSADGPAEKVSRREDAPMDWDSPEGRRIVDQIVDKWEMEEKKAAATVIQHWQADVPLHAKPETPPPLHGASDIPHF